MIKLDHLSVAVRDYRRSRDWYIRVLGLKLEFEVADRSAALQDDAGFTLFLDQIGQVPPPGCVLTFQVDDVHAVHRVLTEAGVEFIHGPDKRFWGYGAELVDPDGYRLRLWDSRSKREQV